MTRHSFPSQPAPIIGRELELAEIANRLTEPACRLLTLTGPGGIGKTRLALETARHLPAAFPDGVYFVALQPLTSSDYVISTMAAALKLSFYGEGDPKQQLLNYLREKHLLLVMDNFEHLMDGVDVLLEVLDNAPRIKILVTSRERLHLHEEWIFDVGGLYYPERGAADSLDGCSAVELFLQSARRIGYVGQSGDTASIIRICQLVEGIPLALELAAGWMRVIPCAEIVCEIERSLDILTSNVRNIPEKHRSMNAVFEHSWKLLTDNEQSVFRKLTVFRGGFTREAAERVAGAALSTLAALVDKSLLRVNADGRYDTHELLRQFAEEQLDAAQQSDQTHDAHCAYYAEFLSRLARDLKGVNQIRALDEIEAEIDNVRLGWRWAVAQGKEHEILQSLDSLTLFYQIRSRFQEAEEAFGMAAMRFGDTENAVLGQSLMLQGWFANTGGHRHRGQELVARGEPILRQIGFHEATAMLFGSVNVRPEELRDYETVQPLYADCLAIFRRTGDLWRTAWALHGLGRLAYHSGRYDEAQRLQQESLATFRAIGDRWGSVLPLHTLGDWAMWRRDYSEARRFFEESLLINKEIGDIAGVAWSQGRLAAIADSLEEFGSSRKYLAEMLKTRFQFGSSWGSPEDEIYLMARWLETQGHTERAVEMFAFLSNADLLSFPELRDKVTRRLDVLRAELPQSTFADAVQRGEGSDLETMVLALRMQLAALDEEIESTTRDTRYDSRLENQLLIEPLTERELEILQLIAEGLSNREIADHLILALSTVKWHINQIYTKLHANSRTQAIARGRALKLLA